MAKINVWDYFECPDITARASIDPKLTVGKLIIDPAELGVADDSDPFFDRVDMTHPLLSDIIREYNNKVGSAVLSYVLLRFYYDKGIPDEPWYQSPGPNGESCKYMPLFEDKHWGIRCWFSYFADVYYLRLFSIWDSILEIMNHFYCYDLKIDTRFRSKLIDKLKAEHPIIAQAISDVANDPLYTEANRYRTAAAHGTSENRIKNTISVQKNTKVKVPVYNGERIQLDENGKQIKKAVEGTMVSYGLGKYTTSKSIMTNIDNFTVFSARKIHELMRLIHLGN